MSGRYVPDRSEIVWLDFEPTPGRETGKYRPAFVLSSSSYNKLTGLLICCPVSTSIRGGPTEVPVESLDEPGVVVTNLIHTLDWRERKVKKAVDADAALMAEVLSRVLPLIGA
jgi:mRNA interferase MazF